MLQLCKLCGGRRWLIGVSTVHALRSTNSCARVQITVKESKVSARSASHSHLLSIPRDPSRSFGRSRAVYLICRNSQRIYVDCASRRIELSPMPFLLDNIVVLLLGVCVGKLAQTVNRFELN